MTLSDLQSLSPTGSVFRYAFYSAPQCWHCKRCTSYGNSVCLSVYPSVTRRHCVKTTARSTVQFALSDSKMWTPLPPEILAQSYPPSSPESSEVWHVSPCSVSTVRAIEKCSIMTNRKSYTGFPTSHQPRFYSAPNFLKMEIRYLNLSSLRQFRQ